MSLIKRSLLAIQRRRKITGIVLGILFAIELIVMLGMSILDGIWDAKEDLRKTYCTSFLVQEDLDVETIDIIASMAGIQSFDVKYEIVSLYSDEVFLIPGLFSRVLETTDYEGYYGKYAEIERIKDYMHTCSPPYHAHRDTSCAPEFRSGEFELIEGRHIVDEDRNVVLISDEVAAYNGLSLGDSYTVKYDMYSYGVLYPQWEGFSSNLTVIGIYHVNATNSTANLNPEWKNPVNTFFLDINTAVEYEAYVGREILYSSGVFFVDNSTELEDAMKNVRQEGNIVGKRYQVLYEDAEYQSAIDQLENLETAIWSFLIVLTGIGVCALYHIMRLSMAERRGEIRNYRRLGVARKNVIAQHVLEYLLLALAAMLPAAAGSAVAAEILGNTTTGISLVLSPLDVYCAVIGSMIVVVLLLFYLVRYEFVFAEWIS